MIIIPDFFIVTKFILTCIWFILPAYIGNMAPVFAKTALKDRLSHPIDFNKEFRGKPIAGKNKTYRGLIAAILLAILVVFIQKSLYSIDYFKIISIIEYDNINWILLGILMGGGAMFGDFIKSIFKRRVGKEPGISWKPMDQIDFLGGALILCSPLYLPPIAIILVIFMFLPPIKILLDHGGYYLKIHDRKW